MPTSRPRASADRSATVDHGLARSQATPGWAAHTRSSCCRPRTTVVRQLVWIRARMLRDTRRGLAARLPLARPELDRLVDLADRRFDVALARLLRA